MWHCAARILSGGHGNSMVTIHNDHYCIIKLNEVVGSVENEATKSKQHKF